MILTEKVILKEDSEMTTVEKLYQCEYHITIQDQDGNPVDLMDCSLVVLDVKKGMIKIIRHVGR